MLKITDKNKRVLGGREINIPSHKSNRYAHIYTLQTDLDLVLLEILEVVEGDPQKSYTLATVNYRLTEQEAITPLFDSLNALDAFVEENMKEIVQDYLFGFVEEDIQLAQVSA